MGRRLTYNILRRPTGHRVQLSILPVQFNRCRTTCNDSYKSCQLNGEYYASSLHVEASRSVEGKPVQS